MAKSIRDVLAEFREHSLDERDKGARFEQLMKDFLQNDTQYQRLFDEVWLWSEYPDRGNRPDTGIDLVARERDTGELVAIQCKFYAPEALISKPDIDSFLASSSKAEFKGRMFISTSDNWGKNAEEAIAGQRPEVSRLGLTDLDESSIDWSKFSFQSPQKLEKKPRKTPRPHQEEAIKNVLEGFKEADRGKLIMACGTGKTFTSLKLVERMFPNGGTVLFLVPSISLLSQALKEWTIESEVSLRSYAVCSDVSVGKRKNDEDLPITDLAFPATTNTERLVEKFTDAGPNQNGLTVIFSTYQSIDVVAQAQSRGIPEFDLIVCDEAHRTTGVTLAGDDETAFVKVHNQGFIKGKKRLYMTATPKVFSDASSKKAEDAGAVLADMGKPDMFGEEFHRLGFGEAVERGILTDYKVLVLAVDEAYVARRFQRQFADDDNELKLEDAAKIVGCWNGLSKRSTEQEEFQIDPGSMKRAVAFARSIAESKKIASMFQAVVDEETAQLDDDEAEYLRCEVEHVDGSFNSLRRNEKLDWLRQEVPDNTARILSNARCLTEGVDVPALDAVMFLNPRDSQVDVVQAVGRVMRKLEGKKYGYVILPIGVPADMDPATALNDNKKYKVVWQVLQALRSHDERFDAMVNKIDLTKKAPQIGIIGIGGGSDGNGKDDNGSVTLDFPNFDQWRDAILAKIVQKVGEKRYWENWARDISDIAARHITRISELVNGSDVTLREKFGRFVRGLQDNLNPSISAEDAIEMLAQHLITEPVFDALFEGYDFSSKNPVSLVMQDMLDALQEQNLTQESESLQKFYESVRSRVAGINEPNARQAVMKQLYEEFFRNAFSKTSEKLGIVYTPSEIVDFMLKSVDEILRTGFGKTLSDRGVHLLDPFTGTGTFLVHLMQSGLIRAEDALEKYRYELHANELVLLAYYVAAVNIETTFSAVYGHEPEAFRGILLTDTFQMHERDDSLDGLNVFRENNQRVQEQLNQKITVVVGNPPYSAGQDSQNDDLQNLSYPFLDSRIASTYAARSQGTLLRFLYDSYIRAMRWASDRIEENGVIAFVSNGGFLNSNTADGLRKVLAEEFSTIYVLNLRGNQRTAGELSRKEGGKVFGTGSRATVAIYFLVKNAESRKATEIKYFDIGDYLTREQKLVKLQEIGSVAGVRWELIVPNENGDWLEQRTAEFEKLAPLSVPKNRVEEAIFRQSSLGLSTGRDAWTNNFSKLELESIVRTAITNFNEASANFQLDKDFDLKRDSKLFSWTSETLRDAKKGKQLQFVSENLRAGIYRPFCKQWVYFDKGLTTRMGSLMEFFPLEVKSNPTILVSAPTPRTPFSVMMVDSVPNLGFFMDPVEVFPRWVFSQERLSDARPDELKLEFGDSEGGLKVDNISEHAVARLRKLSSENASADDVFYYVYGILHSPQYREKFRSDLTKVRARVPFAENWKPFSVAGRELAELHLNYESLTPYPLEVEGGARLEKILKLAYVRKGKSVDKTTIRVNDAFLVRGIPPEVHDYQLGSKSALDWVVDRYNYSVHTPSGIANDPNDWASEQSEEGYILNLLARIITLSQRTLSIVADMPSIHWADV